MTDQLKAQQASPRCSSTCTCRNCRCGQDCRCAGCGKDCRCADKP